VESSFFWGKAQRLDDGQTATHPLVCHCLDVAAVARILLDRFPRRLLWLARLLDADPKFLQGFIVRLIALHDIGKFHPDFQGKLEGYCVKHLPSLERFVTPGGARHDVLGALMAGELDLFDFFEAQLPGWCPSDFNTVFDAITFHHGAPGSTDTTSPWRRACGELRGPVHQFIGNIFATIPCEGALPAPSGKKLAIFSWALAGLTVLADWIGSNSSIFTFFDPPPASLANYWIGARKKAENAVRAAGILPAKTRVLRDPAKFIPQSKAGDGRKREASPLQQMAFELPLGTAPYFFLIEDVTGAGKTEAALILASRLLSEGAASGLYFALPTMATSNAMYERMSHLYRQLFGSDEMPSLVLAHGRRSLNDRFISSILETKLVSRYGDAGGAEPSELACAAWIADDRRKSFFAHVGVGTIDQALLSVLPSRHQALRLWALADRVLIIDEAHCYDPYVNKELQRLIEFHTALGGSAIVLSATLAMKERRNLASAFSTGARPTSAQYPLITRISGDELKEHPIETRKELRRTLPVRRLAQFDDALDSVTSAAEAGAPVAWIRNAVDDAIEACEALEARGHRPLLLHARFAMGDRIEKEREIARRLGRDSKPEDRRGFFAVGTQILEQSLDYDVDAMVTDLAPIDLIIQRAGRLWRHPGRAERFLPAPELLVLSPHPDEVRDMKWYASMSPRAAAVYRDQRVIWRTAKTLFAASEIHSPDKLRELIADVYDTDAPAPEAIEAASREADGKQYSHRAIAEGTLLKLNEGFSGNNQVWLDDRKISTRLEEEPSVVFRLGRIANGEVVPWCDAEDPKSEKDLRLAWALSEVSIQQRHASGVLRPAGAFVDMIAAAKSCWGKWEREIPLLVLEPDGKSWRGRVTAQDKERTAYYDTRLGFRVAD